ncbi:hypothetical protein BJ546DRAFT_653321 [Cryomyces antarcticus]
MMPFRKSDLQMVDQTCPHMFRKMNTKVLSARSGPSNGTDVSSHKTRQFKETCSRCPGRRGGPNSRSYTHHPLHQTAQIKEISCSELNTMIQLGAGLELPGEVAVCSGQCLRSRKGGFQDRMRETQPSRQLIHFVFLPRDVSLAEWAESHNFDIAKQAGPNTRTHLRGDEYSLYSPTMCRQIRILNLRTGGRANYFHFGNRSRYTRKPTVRCCPLPTPVGMEQGKGSAPIGSGEARRNVSES